MNELIKRSERDNLRQVATTCNKLAWPKIKKSLSPRTAGRHSSPSPAHFRSSLAAAAALISCETYRRTRLDIGTSTRPLRRYNRRSRGTAPGPRYKHGSASTSIRRHNNHLVDDWLLALLLNFAFDAHRRTGSGSLVRRNCTGTWRAHRSYCVCCTE